VVKRGGMVVFCAGTTGYNLTFERGYVWMRQSASRARTFAHLKQASAANQFVARPPHRSVHEQGVHLGQIPAAHMMM